MKPYTKKKIILSISFILTLGVGFSLGSFLYRYVFLSPTEQKLLDEYKLLHNDWLYGNEDTYLNNQMAAGLVKGVSTESGDPYTFYTSNIEGQNLSTSYTGSFGITTRYYDGGLYITEVHNGSNYQYLKAGDVLTAVKRDSEDTFVFKQHTYGEISSYIHASGYENSSYLFTLIRNGTETNVTLTRGDFSETLMDVLVEPTSSNGNTLVIRINTFLGSPSTYVQEFLSSYQKSHSVHKLVFDLRGNGGGYVEEAYRLALQFVRKDTLIYARYDKNNDLKEEHYQRNDPTFSFNEYGIILDHNTASASELFTLAMRTGTNCTVYGFTSYGKGIAQNFKTFSDGSVIRYTSSYVYGPKKNNENLIQDSSIPSYDDRICIHSTGIVPDQVFSYDYTYLNTIYDFTQSIGIGEASQNFVLKSTNEIYGWNHAYSKDYHFTDLVKDFATQLKLDFDSEFEPFSESGAMSKSVNDKLNKVTFDKYLEYYDTLTASTLGD